MRDTNIKEYSIKISSSKIGIENTLLLDDDVIVAIIGSVVKIEDSSNQDGTISRTFIVKGEVAEVKNNDTSLLIKEQSIEDIVNNSFADKL